MPLYRRTNLDRAGLSLMSEPIAAVKQPELGLDEITTATEVAKAPSKIV